MTDRQTQNLQNVKLHLAADEGVLLVHQRKPLLHELFFALVAVAANTWTDSAGFHQLAQLSLQDGCLLVDLQLFLFKSLQLVGDVVAGVSSGTFCRSARMTDIPRSSFFSIWCLGW